MQDLASCGKFLAAGFGPQDCYQIMSHRTGFDHPKDLPIFGQGPCLAGFGNCVTQTLPDIVWGGPIWGTEVGSGGPAE